MDPNDLLSTNAYHVIPTPTLNQETPEELNNEFRSYYTAERASLERASLDRRSIDLRSMQHSEEFDDSSIMNTHRFDTLQYDSPAKEDSAKSLKRLKREVKTYVSIDSRDRNKVTYVKPSNFKIFLGKTFYNVKSVRLASIEFPNTNAVINNNNNWIYWRNQEDIDNDIIDTTTGTYPVYSTQLRIGSYISSTLQSEMQNKLANIKRRLRQGDYHYFVVSLDLDTDIVKFTSLQLTNTGANPIQTLINTGTITVNADTTFVTGDIVYIDGSKTLAGIPTSYLTGEKTITSVASDKFTFEVPINATESAVGGGNTVKVGQPSSFQFLFGEASNTIAPNIGFPLENSSERIDTKIESIQNFYQVVVETSQPHGMVRSSEYVGKICRLDNSGTTPNVDGNVAVTDVLNSTTFLVRVNTPLTQETFDINSTVQIGNVTLTIKSLTNYKTQTVVVTFATTHNYSVHDIGKTITFYDTASTPSFDGTQVISQVLSTVSIVVPGFVLAGGPSLTGNTPRFETLTTNTMPIEGLTVGTFTTLRVVNHGLQLGDKVRVFNLVTVPSLYDAGSVFSVYAIPDADHIVFNVPTTSYETRSLSIAYVGTGIVTISFPSHGFNTLVSITNGQNAGDVVVQTTVPHGLTSGQQVRVMGTNSTPAIDGGKYVVDVSGPDTFSFDFGRVLTEDGTSGVLGMNNEFYLYGAAEVGGISSRYINNNKFVVREVLDEDTFTFVIPDVYATSTQRGGGENVYISSLKHGFSGSQTNTKNSLLNRSINLEGENYTFLTCPQLDTMMNTGSVKDVFARITLDQSPGSVVFSFLSNPKVFDAVPLNQLNELEFSVKNYDGSFYEFNDLDYSFVLEITEVIDTTEGFNISSKRGIADAS